MILVFNLWMNSRLALLQILENGVMKINDNHIAIAVDKWYDYIAEPTFADAIMDRLVIMHLLN